jgi:hypothetical protein
MHQYNPGVKAGSTDQYHLLIFHQQIGEVAPKPSPPALDGVGLLGNSGQQ